MKLTSNELFGLLHGMIFGGLYLLAFAGAVAEFINLKSATPRTDAYAKHIKRLKIGTWVITIIVWLTVITGTYIVYPEYRAKPPADVVNFEQYPRSDLLSNPDTAGWHNFGMEWKEHVAWLAPILMTALLYLVIRHGDKFVNDNRLRKIAMTLLFLSFFAAAVAGVFGALITKIAPVS